MSDSHPRNDLPSESEAQTRTPPSDRPPPRPPDAEPVARSSAPTTGASSKRTGRLAPGATLAERYRIMAFLGAGAMGEVYRALDEHLEQTVALKVLAPDLARDAAFVDRFRAEVRIGRELAHPNLCRIYDIVESGGVLLLTMEYVDGEDIGSLLRRIGRLPPDKAVDIARQLCAGLAAAHARGVIHRDLKPGNIMLDGEGRVRITDLGLAAFADQGSALVAREGTPAYMAPEQLRNESVTTRSDIYALGLVLHELFTGQRAFPARSVGELMEQQHTMRPSIVAHVGDVDPAVDRIVKRCLERDPLARPASVMSVFAALPGGDPLAAAIAMGETPTPEMVAAAGTSAALHPAIAWGGFALFAVIAALLVQMAGFIAGADKLPALKEPEAMVDRAREAIERLGAGDLEMEEEAYGYALDLARQADVLANAESASIDEYLSSVRFGAVNFWYRASPTAFERMRSTGLNVGFIGPSEPAWSIPGEIYLSLDLAGRLRRYYRVTDFGTPSASQAASIAAVPIPEPPVDDEAIFRSFGLDKSAFAPAPPRFVSKFRVDGRRAWIGRADEQPLAPVHLEVGWIEGAIIYARMIAPWEETDVYQANLARASDEVSSAEGPQPGLDLIARARKVLGALPSMSILISIALLCGSGWLAATHVQRGRADLSGATRLAAYGVVASALASLMWSERPFPTSANAFVEVLALSVFIGSGAWTGYVAIEPIVRRQWPSMLVAWTRVLAGRFSDPLVGRSVLLGSIVGAGLAVIGYLPWVYAYATVTPAPMPYFFWPLPSLRPHAALASTISDLIIPLIYLFSVLVVLVGIRRIVRHTWLAGALFVPVLAIFCTNIVLGLEVGTAIAAFAIASIIAIVLLARGFLAAATAFVVGNMLAGQVSSAQLGAWHGRETVVVLVGATLIAIWGAWASTRGASGAARVAESSGG